MQDPVLACGMRAHDAAPVHDTAQAGKNQLLHQGYSGKHYSIKSTMVLVNDKI